jgi:hypothetical protein
MRRIFTISVAALLALGLLAFAGAGGQQKGGGSERSQSVEQQGSQDRDRMRTQDETRDRATLRDEEIYGHELMSKEELNQYRKELQTMNSAKKREQFQAQHEEKMRERALQQNRDIVPPGQGPIYRGDKMTVQERNEYREQLRRIESEQERAEFLARHREEMNKRVESVEKETEEAE